MQQTKSYWRLVAVAGVVSAFVGVACTVTTSTGDGFSGNDAGGASGSGTAGASAGMATGSAGKAGAGSAGAGTAGAANAGAGGAAATPFSCDLGDGGTQGEGIEGVCTLDAAEKKDKCAVCLKTTCCTEFSECYAVNPGNECGWGGPKGEGEFVCYRACLTDVAMKNGAVETGDRLACAANCQTPKDTSGMSCMEAIGTATNSLIRCVMNQGCNSDCYGG